ncbi:disease resistance protein RUN1-like [Eucalyptus grandis]|uniref:disease resistance protein RUN1-like n=1 Tax=Eucalyptus grandis TaxID=71139 RepID=UPI00192F0D79|nr:disease resistance protein RUN1-like [Eucalyptus grandis]
MDISHVINPSSSVSSQPDYEVSLSFRGPDMHSGFADFLYTSLTDVGICVFRRTGELESGKEIDPQLIQAIEQSKVSIPVISEEYASSESCLLELDQMVKCMMDNKNRIIIPIFYYVDPSDVCDCSGPFVRTLGEQKKHDRDGTLRCIGELERHHLHEKNEGSHGEVVKQIVHQVQQKLKKQELIVTKQFVRVDCHVRSIMAKLKVDYCNGQAVKIGDTSVTVLGIYGIPGVGKTILAKYVYNQLYHLFDACSFLGEIQAEIKHHGILSLQNKLISDLDKGNANKFGSSKEALLHIRRNFCTMKVLVLLDDVNDHEQLSALVGELDWLGLGSRVILTSQTQDVLRSINGAESSVLEPMKEDEALKLFCRHAFGMDFPLGKFMELSKEIVTATDGLPLALEVIGSSLFLVKSKNAWRETLTALGVAPHKRVQAALEKSYNNLHEEERQIFLDIACFFIGMDKRIPYYMWDDCKYSPSRSIKALIARSLIEIGEDKKLLMLKTLEKFGQEIVKNENRNEPCRRSRLWNQRSTGCTRTKGGKFCEHCATSFLL